MNLRVRPSHSHYPEDLTDESAVTEPRLPFGGDEPSARRGVVRPETLLERRLAVETANLHSG
jgi:hypothetical protein